MIAPGHISLQLVFAAEIAHRIGNASQELAKQVPSTFILGTDIPPHITLFNYIDIKPEMPLRQTVVRFSDLQQLDDKDGRIWVAMGIAKTPALISLRTELIAICGYPALLRDEFHPHVTLGNICAHEWEKSASVMQRMLTGMNEAQCITRIFSVPA